MLVLDLEMLDPLDPLNLRLLCDSLQHFHKSRSRVHADSIFVELKVTQANRSPERRVEQEVRKRLGRTAQAIHRGLLRRTIFVEEQHGDFKQDLGGTISAKGRSCARLITSNGSTPKTPSPGSFPSSRGVGDLAISAVSIGSIWGAVNR